jgi:hypothetical protein
VVLNIKGLFENLELLGFGYFNVAACGDGVDAPKAGGAPAKTATSFDNVPYRTCLRGYWWWPFVR